MIHFCISIMVVAVSQNDTCDKCKKKKKKKRQPNELKICATNITNKGLILKIYKEFIQLNIKNNKQPNLKKIGREPGNFFKEDIKIANRHMKKCSTSLIIRGMKLANPQ